MSPNSRSAVHVRVPATLSHERPFVHVRSTTGPGRALGSSLARPVRGHAVGHPAGFGQLGRSDGPVDEAQVAGAGRESGGGGISVAVPSSSLTTRSPSATTKLGPLAGSTRPWRAAHAARSGSVARCHLDPQRHAGVAVEPEHGRSAVSSGRQVSPVRNAVSSSLTWATVVLICHVGRPSS